jgi:hypothetical protein
VFFCCDAVATKKHELSKRNLLAINVGLGFILPFYLNVEPERRKMTNTDVLEKHSRGGPARVT